MEYKLEVEFNNQEELLDFFANKNGNNIRINNSSENESLDVLMKMQEEMDAMKTVLQSHKEKIEDLEMYYSNKVSMLQDEIEDIGNYLLNNADAVSTEINVIEEDIKTIGEYILNHTITKEEIDAAKAKTASKTTEEKSAAAPKKVAAKKATVAKSAPKKTTKTAK